MARRSDAFLILAVAVLGGFVVKQVVSRKPAPAAARSNRPAAQSIAPQAPAQAGAASASGRPAVTQSATTAPQPARDIEAIKARIAGTPGTYMPAMLADLGGQLVRWPDRRQDGLRIWVQAASPVRDWSLTYAQMARNSFADWGSAGDGLGVPVRLDFVLDSVGSDIQIVWVDRFPPDMGRRVGSTDRATDQSGWITAARITVAIHDSAGRTITPESLAGIVRHEAGHALGLGHSNDPATKMYPTEMVSDIRPADRATLRLLYLLSPGSVP